MLHPESCIAAQLAVARRHGAELHLGERVLEVDTSAAAAQVRTTSRTFSAAQVVLCTGAWLPGMVGGPLATPRLRVLRQVLHWFDTERSDWYDPKRCPVFIWLHGPTVEEAMYGFPLGDGQPGVKVATEQLSEETDPDRVERHITESEVQAMFNQHLHGRLLGLQPRTVHGTTCLYTMAPDGGFVVDRHEALKEFETHGTVFMFEIELALVKIGIAAVQEPVISRFDGDRGMPTCVARHRYQQNFVITCARERAHRGKAKP